MKSIWVRENAQPEEVARKICEVFNWNNTSGIQYMYANGRYLRVAKLEDVENADSWDADAVRVLMGTGCLYVVKRVQEEVYVESSTVDDDGDDDDIVVPLNQQSDVANDLPSKVGSHCINNSDSLFHGYCRAYFKPI